MNEIQFGSWISNEQFVRSQFRRSFVRNRVSIVNKIILILIILLLIIFSCNFYLSAIYTIYLSVSLLIIFVIFMMISRFFLRAFYILICNKDSLLSEEISYIVNSEFIQFLHKRGEYSLEWEKVNAVIFHKEDLMKKVCKKIVYLAIVYLAIMFLVLPTFQPFLIINKEMYYRRNWTGDYIIYEKRIGCYADALEQIYEDGGHIYYLGAIVSHWYRIKIGSDKFTIQEALEQGKITIDELMENMHIYVVDKY